MKTKSSKKSSRKPVYPKGSVLTDRGNPLNPETYNFRLRKDRKSPGLRGPDPIGCFNSGIAAVIVRDWHTGLYLVGHQGAYEDPALKHEFLKAYYGTLCEPKPRYGTSKCCFQVYKTKAPAIAAYKRLVDKQKEYNAQARKEIAEAQKRVRSQDSLDILKGALTLTDHGLL